MIIEVFLCCGKPVGTYILGSTCAWWQKTTNKHTHTHGTTTVTLAVYACRGLIIHQQLAIGYQVGNAGNYSRQTYIRQYTYMFCTIWEYPQTRDCVTHIWNLENVCQFPDCVKHVCSLEIACRWAHAHTFVASQA